MESSDRALDSHANLWKENWVSRRIGRRSQDEKCQPAYKPGSVWHEAEASYVTAIHLGRPLPNASRNLPERLARKPAWSQNRFWARVAPIRFCSRWGLPCRVRCRPRGGLLPHPFTLTPPTDSRPAFGAVCFLWHFP